MSSIRSKIVVLVLSLALGEAAVLGVIGYSAVNTSTRVGSEFRQLTASLDEKNAFVLAVTRAQADAKLYAVRRDDQFRRAFEGEWASVERRLRGCRTMCHGLAEQPQHMLENIRPAVKNVRDDWTRLVGRDGEAAAADLAGPIEGETTHIVVLAELMSEKIRDRLRRLEEKADLTRHTALMLLLLATVGTVFVAMALNYPVVKSITQPLRRLVDGVRRFAAGDLAHRVPEAGGDEIVVLARSFNEMADSLAGQQAALREEIRKRDASLSVSERLATIGLLASSVGHEINNPLTSVLMNARLAMERLEPDSPARPLIERLIAETDRCRGIVVELRRIGQRRSAQMEACSARLLVEDAVRASLTRAKLQGVELQTELETPDPVGLCDRQKMLQVLVNLVDNALDVSAPGQKVLLRARQREGQLAIEVADQGPGIPAEVRGRIFDRFFTTKAHGLGLGLAISRHLVEEQGGRMEVETTTSAETTTAGRAPGTTFRIELPAAGGGTS